MYNSTYYNNIMFINLYVVRILSIETNKIVTELLFIMFLRYIEMYREDNYESFKFCRMAMSQDC